MLQGISVVGSKQDLTSIGMLDIVLIVKLNFGPDTESHMAMLVSF